MKKRSGDCKGVKKGSNRMSSRRGSRGRKNSLKDSHEMDNEVDDSCKKVVAISNGRVRRSASKKVGGEMDSRCQIVERRVSGSASKRVGGDTNSLCPIVERRITRSASKRMGGDTVSHCQIAERLITRSASKRVGGNTDSHYQIVETQMTPRASKRVGRGTDSQSPIVERRITRSASKRVGGNTDSHCQIVETQMTPRASKRVGRDTDSHSPIVERRITRSASKRVGRDTNSHSPIVERRITRSASKRVGRNTDSHCQIVERQMTRSASKRVGGNTDSHSQIVERQLTPSASKRVGRDTDSHCQIVERRITRSASKQVVRKAEKFTRDIDVKRKEINDCVDVDIDRLGKGSRNALPLCLTTGKEESNKQDLTVDTKRTGVKRKRKQLGLQGGTTQGWTKEQELELHRAYFTAKPSPHFWKRVAKMVPGKSAQECFDKVHSENQTPVCSKPSLRSKKKSPLSGNEFDFAKKESKKTSKAKCKSHVGRKSVRHLLQKYCHVNQDSETDLFSILEPSVNPSVQDFNLTPEHLMRSPDSSSKSRDRCSSGYKKCLSRFNDKNESLLTSPPVLKKVKNIDLHEKYIDQLHTREHKRKLSFSRYMKSAQHQQDGQDNSIQLKAIIKTAKEALVSEATDAINKYRDSQANIMDTFSDSEEFLYSDDEEDETVV